MRIATAKRKSENSNTTHQGYLMKIAVIGTGYVGIVAGACWANVGHKVTCVDIDAAKIAMLSKGISPIFEPDLEDRITAGLREKTLHFTTDITSAVRDSEVSIIAVGTPSDPDGAFNSRYVLGAAKAIGDACRGLTDPRYVVIRSTINTDIFKEVPNSWRKALPCVISKDLIVSLSAPILNKRSRPCALSTPIS